MNFINKKIKQEFEIDGYAAIYSFFEEDKIQEIKNELDRYINIIAPTLPNHHVFYEDKEDKSTIKNLQQMFTYDDYFKQLIEESKIQELASSILGEKAIAKNLQYFNNFNNPDLNYNLSTTYPQFYYDLFPQKNYTFFSFGVREWRV